MHWDIKSTIKEKTRSKRRQAIVKAVFSNRGLTKKTDIDAFLHPPNPLRLTPKQVGIDPAHVRTAIKRIQQAIQQQQPIIVFGDYDADGICATAILWETLHQLGAKTLPFIPQRQRHGYGLSSLGIKDIISDNKFKHTPPLIITVDNGIVAHKAADYCKQNDIDLIITDHHQPSDTPPQALAIIHTTQLAGAGVAWIFAKELVKHAPTGKAQPSASSTLDLAAIGTVTDLMPLKSHNRAVVTHGIEAIKTTHRPGLKTLLSQARIDPKAISTYHISYLIGPRINAMGRLESGLDSLRLLCTTSNERADRLATTLTKVNEDRKDLTYTLVEKAKAMIGETDSKLLIIQHQDFHEGVIGLIAGKLVEEYYRPAIVISQGDKTSKASARSIRGVNIIQLIRQADDLLINAGGHTLAAGFSIETSLIDAYRQRLSTIADKTISDDLLTPTLTVDCEITLDDISWPLYKKLEQLHPFGMGNPRPTFAITDIAPLDITTVGPEGKHLKLILPSKIKQQPTLQALWFNHGYMAKELATPTISLAASLDANTWNGRTTLQMKVKDVR